MLDMYEAMLEGGRHSVSGANGVGKSWTIAEVAVHYLVKYPDALVLITSSSFDQLMNGVWRYISKNAERLRALGVPVRVGARHISMGRDRFIHPISPSKPESFAGIHSEHVAVIVDEGSGVPSWIEETLEGNNPHLVIISYNPLRPAGYAYKSFCDPGYTKWTFSALDHPNVKQRKRLIPRAVTYEDVQRKLQSWGEASPAYIARVLGQFPEAAGNRLYTATALENARRLIVPDVAATTVLLGMGYDAGFGGGDPSDMTVLRMHGKNEYFSFVSQEEFDYAKIALTNTQAIRIMKHHNILPRHVLLDKTGAGIGTIQDMHARGYKIRGVNFSNTARDDDSYSDVATEMAYEVQSVLDEQILSLAGAPQELFDEMIARQIDDDGDRKGRLKLEPKKKLKARGLPSPNRLDSLMLALRAVKKKSGVNYVFG